MAPVVAFNDTERAQLETLVDGSVITRAKTKHAEATAARDRMKQEYEAARAAAETASAGYQAALRGEVTTSPLDAFHAMDAAIKARDVAGEVLNHVSQALNRAESGISEGMGIAYRPVYAEGVRLRLAAASKADQARALLAEAEADYLKGSAVVQIAYDHGCAHPIPYFQPALTSETTARSEENLWTGSSGRDWLKNHPETEKGAE